MIEPGPVTRFQLAELGSLLADPARAAILLSLLDGSARPATELALLAAVAPATASAHLRKLEEGGLLAVLRQGRHRYYRLADEDIAHMLEALTFARSSPQTVQRVAQTAPELARARTCYQHLAGRLGVALFERLRLADGLLLENDSVRLSPRGSRLLAAAGLVADGDAAERLLGRSCLDWTERRFHLAGPLGCHLTRRLFDLHWLRRSGRSRALMLGPRGHDGLQALGLAWDAPRD